MSTEEPSATETIEFGRRRPARRSYWPARLRVLRVLGKLMLAGLFLVVFTVGVCRVTRMIGLPDVGDPFEPRAQDPQSRAGGDSMVVYAQAAGQLMRSVGGDGPTTSRSSPLLITWADAPPARRRWVQVNRESLDLFRRGSELPAVPWPDSPSPMRSMASNSALDELVWLALLEGDRLKDSGDVKAAWSWYLAALRSTYHRAQGNDASDRVVVQRLRGPIADRIDAWAQDTKVGPELLRKALDDVLACRSLMPSDLKTLENGYRLVKRELDAGHFSEYIPHDQTASESWYRPLSFVGWQVGRFLDNEPERSRRVARLAFANWRAWLVRPDGERPRPAVKSLILDRGWTQRLDFFEPPLDAPAAARRMSPARLASWADTCRDARFPLSYFWSTFQSTRAAEQLSYRNLVVQTAEQLYLRERGTMPPGPEALVGPYLKTIPEDGSSEADDGTTPSGSPGG
jgi:hypothetical protein